MASIAEQTLDGFKAALLGQIAGVDQNVARARADPFSFDEAPWINIERGEENSRVFGEAADDNELSVAVEIGVKATQDEVWETKADAIAVQVHRKLFAYTAWPPSVARLRKTGSIALRDEASNTAGKLTLTYVVRFLTAADDLESGPG